MRILPPPLVGDLSLGLLSRTFRGGEKLPENSHGFFWPVAGGAEAATDRALLALPHAAF